MTVRGIEARIVKLESRRRHDGEFYVMWRLPGDDIESAVAAAHLPRGTKVICAEWFGELPPPPGRWVSADTRRLSEPEDDYAYQTALRHVATKHGISEDDLRKNTRKSEPHPAALQMTDLELEYAVFGVTVQ